jgi:hypothetical protein
VKFRALIALTLAASALALAASTLAVAAPAAAAGEVTTTTTFAKTELTAPFGSDWQLAVRVTISNSFGSAPIQPNDGSIDILIDGMPGEYVTGAAIVPGGVAYFAQPANEPPLAAGTYKVTANFTPAAGSGLDPSTTKKTATLTIEPLTVVPTVELISDPSVTPMPVVRTSLAGTFVETTGAPPSGTWKVTAVDSDGATGFEGTAEQPTQGQDGAPVAPLDIPIDSALKSGETYTVTAVFAPDELLAGGLVVEESPPATFTTKAATASEVLGAPVGVPVIVTVLVVVLIAGLIALLVWLIRSWRRAAAPMEIATALAEPAHSVAPPALAAPHPTLALPPVLEPENRYLPDLPSHPLTPPPAPAEPTSWSLSDLGLGEPDDPDKADR